MFGANGFVVLKKEVSGIFIERNADGAFRKVSRHAVRDRYQSYNLWKVGIFRCVAVGSILALGSGVLKL